MSNISKPIRVLTCLVVAISTIVWRESAIISAFEQKFYDLRMRLLASREVASDDIVIVGVDDESLDRLKPAIGRWPWPRAIFAGIIDYCSQARVIAVDILFPEADVYHTTNEDLLAKEVRKQANVIFAIHLSNQASNNLIPPSMENFALDYSFANEYPLMDFHSAIVPYSSLLVACSGLGHVNYGMDGDGVMRSYLLASRLAEKIYPSLGLATALKCKELFLKKPKIDEKGMLILNKHNFALEGDGNFRFIPTSQQYKTFSAVDILSSWRDDNSGKKPAISRREFNGKVVLVGSLATGLLADQQVTTGAGNLPGVCIEARVVDNLLNGQFIRLLPDVAQVMLILVLCFIPIFPDLKRPRVMILVVFSLSILYLVVVVYCLLFQKLMLPVTAPYIGLFTSSITLGVGYWYTEISHRKRLEANLKDAYTSLQLTNERLEEYSHTLEVKVDQRTSELKEKNNELENENVERRRIEQTLVKQSEELAITNIKLKSISRHKDQFLACMSHELRTPLNAILGASELLAGGIYGPMKEKQLKSVKMISDGGHHLLALINDILDLAKIEEGKIDLNIDAVPIESVCQASLQFIKELAHKKGIEVISTFNVPNVGMLHTDERRLKQILVNLLSNAVKFAPEKGRVGIDVFEDTESKQIRFLVWDTGIGISENDRERLFQPFVQLDSSLERQHEGTGLGLSLVDRFAKMLGGSVSLESDVGKGSRFTVSLPWNENLFSEKGNGHDYDPRSNFVLENAKIFRREKRSASILVAEDNEATIETIQEYLQFNGFQVLQARSGDVALKQVIENQPDLIVMDVQIPKMDGLEVIRQLRSNDKFTKIPIIVLTALAMPGDSEKCMKAGADKYISKPVKLRNLLEVIEEFLEAIPRKQKQNTKAERSKT